MNTGRAQPIKAPALSSGDRGLLARSLLRGGTGPPSLVHNAEEEVSMDGKNV